MISLPTAGADGQRRFGVTLGQHVCQAVFAWGFTRNHQRAITLLRVYALACRQAHVLAQDARNRQADAVAKADEGEFHGGAFDKLAVKFSLTSQL